MAQENILTSDLMLLWQFWFGFCLFVFAKPEILMEGPQKQVPGSWFADESHMEPACFSPRGEPN